MMGVGGCARYARRTCTAMGCYRAKPKRAETTGANPLATDCAFGLHSFSFFPSIAAMRAIRFRSVALAAFSLAAVGWPAIDHAAPAAPAPPAVASIATTTAGKVRGYVDQGIDVFRGIPYGSTNSTRLIYPVNQHLNSFAYFFSKPLN